MNIAYAMGQLGGTGGAGGAGGLLGTPLVPIILMLAVMWFFPDPSPTKETKRASQYA